MSGYNDDRRRSNLPPWDPSQISDYFNDTFPSDWPTPHYAGVPVTVDNVTPPPPGAYGNANDTTFDEAENSLDIEMAGSAAPGRDRGQLLLLGGTVPEPADNGAARTGGRRLRGRARRRPSPTTTPAPDSTPSPTPTASRPERLAWNLELAHAAATGVTVVAASGGPGRRAERRLRPLPGPVAGHGRRRRRSRPTGRSRSAASASLLGGSEGTWSAEASSRTDSTPTSPASPRQTAWYDGDSAGKPFRVGGRALDGHPRAGMAVRLGGAAGNRFGRGLQGASLLGRASPDVAFAANDTVAYVAHDANGSFFTVLEGTSIAAPFFAGLLAEWSAVRPPPSAGSTRRCIGWRATTRRTRSPATRSST